MNKDNQEQDSIHMALANMIINLFIAIFVLLGWNWLANNYFHLVSMPFYAIYSIVMVIDWLIH